MKRHPITLALLLVSLFALSSAFAADTKKGPRIKKCQDAQGNWHYGDKADEECARSKVIEIDQRGIKRKEIAAPLTDAQLKEREAQREEAERARKAAEEQSRRDELLLSTYAVEADITLTRDRKLSDLDAQIRSNEETLKSLRNSQERLQKQAADEQRGGKTVSPQTAQSLSRIESQVSTHEAVIEKMRKEKTVVSRQFEQDLERYRSIKRGQVKPAPQATTPAAPARR